MIEKTPRFECSEKSMVKELPYNSELIEKVVVLDKKCFPLEWQYDDATEYYDEVLQDRKNIKKFLVQDETVVGYILGRPHNELYEELTNHDAEFTKSDASRFYIESIAIIPEAQGEGGGEKLILALCDDAVSRGINNFSIHARTSNHLNDLIKKLFNNKITVSRSISAWHYANGEPYEYLEWSV